MAAPPGALLQRQTSKAAMEAGLPKCAGCDQALGREVLEAVGGKWHPACFVCSVCKKPFDDGCFVWNAKEGKPLHKACHTEAAAADGPKCENCGQLLDGKYVVVQGKKYHAACFVCGVCGCTLKGGYGMSTEGKPLCATHLGEQGRSRVPLDGADKYRIDVTNFEKIYIESGTRREYRLGADGVKRYEDERARPKYGGNTTWRQA